MPRQLLYWPRKVRLSLCRAYALSHASAPAPASAPSPAPAPDPTPSPAPAFALIRFSAWETEVKCSSAYAEYGR